MYITNRTVADNTDMMIEKDRKVRDLQPLAIISIAAAWMHVMGRRNDWIKEHQQ